MKIIWFRLIGALLTFLLGCYEIKNEPIEKAVLKSIDSIPETIEFPQKADTFYTLMDTTSLNFIDSSIVDFGEYTINTKSIGKIKIKMRLSEAETKGNLRRFNKKEFDSFGFGVDGGGPGYLYLINKTSFIGIVPQYGSDTIKYLYAIHPKLKTVDGISPVITVENLLLYYPDLEFQKSLLDGSEFAYDSERLMDFVFYTDSTNQIGVYPTLESKSKPFRKNVEMDWILVY